MNIIERGRAFVQGLRQLGRRTAWEWRQCPYCGSLETKKNGSYWVHPYTLEGRQAVCIQRHRCDGCGRSYSESATWRVGHSRYAREVQRMAVDSWQHGGMSLRRTAEWVRSVVGKQERWMMRRRSICRSTTEA